ncbi:MAG TPA: glycine--tRNA ligase subunit beta [Bryobacteraceae bacterium]|nr:glycine--tRNA ligase subunit beta [Bryobacteraceae bacterium]
MSLPFVLEVGTEEIPDWMIVPAMNQLQDMFQALLDQNSLAGKVSSADATPRRLVLKAAGLIDRQPDTDELVSGPPKSAGPGAAAGFAKKLGATPDQLIVQTTAKGEYYFLHKRTQGQATAAILARELPNLILKIQWPKTMYWNGKGSQRFIRPIRWLVALLGESVIPFEIGGVRSGNATHGHRLLGKTSILITTADFDEQLRTNGVILQAEKRRDKIETEIAGLLDGKNLRIKPDPDLLHTLTYITEFPSPILGSFDSQYLELPSEVLITVMRHHQKYFSVEDSQGNLAPHFIAVMNTNADPEGLVRHGNERVLRARFNDARFFWQQDQKKKLEDRLSDLKNVTFQAKVGSYYEKTQRVVDLVKLLGGDSNTQRAALLCKTDLTTDMVKEFTDLQGVVGGLYAKAQGEPEPVWRAVYDHYKPLSMEGEIPSTAEGRVLSLADKWDTLASCFSVGLAPTGSKDPFALRRAAQGVVRIVVEGKVKFDSPGMPPDLEEFMRDRVEYYFRDVRNFAYDEVRACMAAGWRDLIDLESRLKRVQAIRPTPDFEPIAASFKRIKNILKQAGFTEISAVDESLIEPGPERRLYDEFQRTSGQSLESRITPLRPKIDLFFDKVLVNAPDPAVRKNRLTLLHRMLQEFSDIADFSEIVTERSSS